MGKSFSNPARKFISINEEEVQYIDPAMIKTSEPFESLFAIKEEVYTAVKANMLEHGYDETQPVILWKEKDVLIDGHTRRKSAIDTNQKQIPYRKKSFLSEEEALDYMFHLQCSRRNINDSELIDIGIGIISRYEKEYGKGSKVELLAQRLEGFKPTKLKQLVVVIERASEEQLKSIRDGNTIYSVYTQVKGSRDATPEKVKTDKLTASASQSPAQIKKPENKSQNSNKLKNPSSGNQSEQTSLAPELYINEGNIYDNKSRNIVVSVNSKYHNEDMLNEILDIVKKYI